MDKFISKENLAYAWRNKIKPGIEEAIEPISTEVEGIKTDLENKLDKPEVEGTVGQVLTKTADGTEWADAQGGGEIDPELEKRVETLEDAVEPVEETSGGYVPIIKETDNLNNLNIGTAPVFSKSQDTNIAPIQGFKSLQVSNFHSYFPLGTKIFIKIPENMQDDYSLIGTGNPANTIYFGDIKNEVKDGYYEYSNTYNFTSTVYITVTDNGSVIASDYLDVLCKYETPKTKIYSKPIKEIQDILEIGNFVNYLIPDTYGISPKAYNEQLNNVSAPSGFVSINSGPIGFPAKTTVFIPVDESFPDNFCLIYVWGTSRNYLTVKEAKEKAVNGYVEFAIPFDGSVYVLVKENNDTQTSIQNPANYINVLKTERNAIERIDNKISEIDNNKLNIVAGNTGTFLRRDNDYVGNSAQYSWQEIDADIKPLTSDEVDEILGTLKINTAFIKTYHKLNGGVKYYLPDNYVQKDNEVPIGVSIKTDNNPKGFTIALKYGNTNTPDEGGDSKQYMAFGLNGVEIEGITPTTNTTTLQADYNGAENTAKILAMMPDESWKTTTPVGSASATNAPAAICAWRYSTPGTKQGDWYLPAYGEVNETRWYWRTLEAAFTKLGINTTDMFVWTSNVSNNSNAWGATLFDSRTWNYGRQTSQYVVPFSKF